MPGAMNLNGKAPATPSQAPTPPCTPIDDSPQHCVQQPVTRNELKDLLVEVIREIRAVKPDASGDTTSEPAGPQQEGEKDQEKDDKRVRASKVEYKTVNEVYAFTCSLSWAGLMDMRRWDSKTYTYKIVDSPQAQDVSELDEYVFVIRKRIRK
jgi:hypothetical protein